MEGTAKLDIFNSENHLEPSAITAIGSGYFATTGSHGRHFIKSPVICIFPSAFSRS